MSENRIAWLRTINGQFVLLHYPEGSLNEDGEEGDTDRSGQFDTERQYGYNLQLLIPILHRKPLTINLTSLTIEELEMTRQFFNTAFDMAEPVVRLRDQVAEDAFANGDDSFARSYRPVPQLVIRKRQEQLDVPRLHLGSEDPPDGAGSNGAGSGGVRGVRDELAPGESEESQSQDDEPEADKP